MKVVSDVSVEKWDEILNKSVEVSFFQTPLWAKILEETYNNYRIATRFFIFGNDLEVLVPCMEINLDKYGLRKKYESMPLGTYGGLISNKGAVTTSHIKRIIRSFKTPSTVSINFNLNPLSNAGIEYPLEGVLTPSYTHVLSLEKGFDHIWQNEFRGTTRNQCRKAEKNGVEVYVDNSIGRFEEYYTIYVASSKRWGKDKPNYPFRLFKVMNKIGQSRIRLWIAVVQDKMISGALNFYYGDTVSYWSGAMLKEYSKYCPNNLLFKTAILNACEEGYRYYNFGASGNLEGVRRFKESFGAKKADYNIYSYNNNDLSYKLHKRVSALLTRGWPS